MSEPFLAEIRIVGFNFPPRGWATCDGQILPISQNQALYSLLGTTYGGDGRTSFALPDLRGRAPLHAGSVFSLGQRGGEEAHTLSVAEIPGHDHAIPASNDDASTEIPASGSTLATAPRQIYGPPEDLQATAIGGGAGGGQSHDNMQPYLAVTFVIALQGLFPSRN